MAEHHDQQAKRARQLDKSRARARLRAIQIRFGEVFRGLAKHHIEVDPETWAARRHDIVLCLVQSVDFYQRAGMSRKAQAIGRWGEWLRREMARQEGWE